MSDFDERSGTVPCKASWGHWHQTLEDVTVEANVPQGTKGKECKVVVQPKHLEVTVKGETIIKGRLFQAVLSDDITWTLQDNKLLQLIMSKSNRTAKNCWHSLLIGQFEADAGTLDEMEKKLALQRFQMENPGMDFSDADISGNYHNGGPSLPS